MILFLQPKSAFNLSISKQFRKILAGKGFISLPGMDSLSKIHFINRMCYRFYTIELNIFIVTQLGNEVLWISEQQIFNVENFLFHSLYGILKGPKVYEG